MHRNTIIPREKIDTPLTGVLFSLLHPGDTIFYGTFSGLYASYKNAVKNILPHRITSLVIDSHGYAWAGTWLNGLFKIKIKNSIAGVYDAEDVTALTGQKQIRALYADSKNNLWVGTRYAGAYLLQSKADQTFAAEHFNRQSGLISDWVTGFAETPEGDMWIGTYLGLDKLINTQSGYRVFNFSKVVNFFADIKKIIPAGDRQWLCVANKGVAFFEDEKLHLTPPPPARILSATLGTGENKMTVYSPDEEITLKPTQNAARFEFGALSFINERQIMYSFRLRGSADSAWSKPENIHETSYASLLPGKYVFEVKTIGWNGESSPAAVFPFYISIPFWKQGWFIALCILAIAIFFYALNRYRINQLLRLQTVRNHIAKDLHDEIGSSLTHISILSELSAKHLSQPEKAEPFLKRISEEVQTSSQAMDDIIWSVNSRNDSLQETMARMRRYAAELFDNSDTHCHVQIHENPENKKLSMEQRRDVYLVYKEALTNIHKHAFAGNVWIEINQNKNYLFMKIKDDGKGFNTSAITHRNGLKNLQTRVNRWNGSIRIQSQENKGTSIDIKIPLKE